MKFFKGRGASSSRRSNRLWMLRLKKAGMALGLVAILSGLAAYGWSSGFFSRAGEVIAGRALAFTGALGFRVGEILVTGRDNIPQEELLTQLNIERDAPIFGVSVDEAQTRLVEIAWVKDVRVSRRLPDKIVVDIEERAPAALWQYHKKISAIDAEGHILTGDNLEKYKNLPLIVGEGASTKVMQIVDLLKAEPAIAAQLASAVRVGDRRWDLRLKNGITVRLPEADVELALSMLAAAQERNNILAKNIDTIDLRLPEKMVVEPKEDKNNKTNI